MSFRLLAIAAAVLTLPAGLPGQNSGRPLEVLRAEARTQIQRMEVQFDLALREAVRSLARIAPDEESSLARSIREQLLPWAGVFPAKFIAQIRESSNDRARQNLIRILAAEGSPSSANALLSLLGGKDDAWIVSRIGFMEQPGSECRAAIHALANGERESAPDVQAAALRSLARLKDRRTLALARGVLERASTEELSIAAAEAMAMSFTDGRADSEILRIVARDPSKPATVRAAAVRALASFPQSLDNLRTLHDSLDDATPVVKAALDALARVGDRSTSRNYLLKIVREHSEEPIRTQAAIVLSGLGIYDGAQLLVRDLRRQADERPREPELQRALADQYYQLHAWPLALESYGKAASARGFAAQSEVRYLMARCRARLGQFDRARADLTAAGYDSFHTLAEDPAFEQMRQHPRFAPLFRAPN